MLELKLIAQSFCHTTGNRLKSKLKNKTGPAASIFSLTKNIQYFLSNQKHQYYHRGVFYLLLKTGEKWYASNQI